eukprot:9107094-Pyramimonas_sp.AAC.1
MPIANRMHPCSVCGPSHMHPSGEGDKSRAREHLGAPQYNKCKSVRWVIPSSECRFCTAEETHMQTVLCVGVETVEEVEDGRGDMHAG